MDDPQEGWSPYQVSQVRMVTGLHTPGPCGYEVTVASTHPLLGGISAAATFYSREIHEFGFEDSLRRARERCFKRMDEMVEEARQVLERKHVKKKAK